MRLSPPPSPDERAIASSFPSRQEPLSRRHRVLVGAIVSVGLIVRLAYVAHATSSPGFFWEDPDGYARQALRLATDDGWRWTFRAVTYTIKGQQHALPPLYSVFLSFLAMFPGFPSTAIIAHALLGGLSIVLMFMLGRSLHSAAAGLIAAAAYALWIPNIFGVWSTSQETIYVPLILTAFLSYMRAIHSERTRLFALSGAVFGLAALTRSMPLFFMVPAACVHTAMTPNRRQAVQQMAVFLAGFLAVTAPYSAALSRHFGAITIIDTHGSIHVEAGSGQRAPGLLATAGALWKAISAAPADYIAGCVARARSLLHVNGGRILQTYVVARDRTRAIAWKTLVHVGTDVLLAIGAVIGPLGAIVCRERRVAMLFLLWAAVNIAIASLGGFGGARLRVPFEPFLMILGAAALAGSWRRPAMTHVLAAGVASATLAAAVLPQVPRSLTSWPDYGVSWPSIFNRRAGAFESTAGLNVPAYEGLGVITVTPRGSWAPDLHVRIGGLHVRTVPLAAGQDSVVRLPWPARGLAFVEVQTGTAPPAGEPDIEIRVAGR